MWRCGRNSSRLKLKNFAKKITKLDYLINRNDSDHWMKELVKFKREILSTTLLNTDQLKEKSPGIGVYLCALELSV